MSEDLEDFFLNRKPVELMVTLRRQGTDNYASALSRQVDATYAHTVKVLQRMKDYGLIQFEKKGRKKEIELTSEGESIAEHCANLIEELQAK